MMLHWHLRLRQAGHEGQALALSVLALAPGLHQSFTHAGSGMGDPEATEPLPHNWGNG